MPQTALSNIGVNYGWNAGEDGWKAGMDRNLLLLDRLAQCTVTSRATTTPPGAPGAGEAYIVPATGATGAWTGHANKIATYDTVNSAWVLVVPLEGWLAYVQDEDTEYVYTGSVWAVMAMQAGRMRSRLLTLSGGTLTVDTSLGAAFDVVLTANVSTLTLSNPVASGNVSRFTLRVRQDATGGRTFALPTAVKTPAAAGYTPTSTANAVDLLEFTTYDAGATWYLVATKNFS